MKNYLSSALTVNDSPKVSKKLRLVTIADPLTNVRLLDWLSGLDYEVVASSESVEKLSRSDLQADIVVARIHATFPQRLEFVEKISRQCARLLIIGSSSDSELAAAVVRHNVKGYVCQQTKETFCSALSVIAAGGYYVEPEIFKQLQIPHLKASQERLLEWSYVLSIELLARWINIAISPIPVREIFLELGLLRTERFIFNELIVAPTTEQSLDKQLNEHIHSLREVSKQTDSEFKIAVVCQEINDWVFNSCHNLIRMRVKELKERKVRILEEILAPLSNGGTQSLLNYYRDLREQITQLRDDYLLNERESAAVENASYEAYCQLKGSGIPKIDALCLSG
jgi:DNA-binding NarL/FixJ family response regulator